MKKLRAVSVAMLLFSGLGGMVRGYRMMRTTSRNSVLFPYAEEAIKLSFFSNYRLLGGIVFSLVGVFSMVTLLAMLRRNRFYGYLMIVEGIFMTFFCLAHMIFNGLMVANTSLLVFCLLMKTAGVLQTPKEF